MHRSSAPVYRVAYNPTRIQGDSMNKMKFGRIAIRIFVLGFVLSTSWQAQAQVAKAPYPQMAPLEQYLMADRDAEIAMARSAAPEAISRDAKVLFSGGTATRPLLKARTVSCVSWSERGCRHSMRRGFGTPSFGVRFASIRRPLEPSYRLLSRELSWCWLDCRKRKSSKASRHLTRRNCCRWKRGGGAKCCARR